MILSELDERKLNYSLTVLQENVTEDLKLYINMGNLVNYLEQKAKLNNTSFHEELLYLYNDLYSNVRLTHSVTSAMISRMKASKYGGVRTIDKFTPGLSKLLGDRVSALLQKSDSQIKQLVGEETKRYALVTKTIEEMGLVLFTDEELHELNRINFNFYGDYRTIHSLKENNISRTLINKLLVNKMLANKECLSLNSIHYKTQEPKKESSKPAELIKRTINMPAEPTYKSPLKLVINPGEDAIKKQLAYIKRNPDMLGELDKDFIVEYKEQIKRIIEQSNFDYRKKRHLLSEIEKVCRLSKKGVESKVR